MSDIKIFNVQVSKDNIREALIRATYPMAELVNEDMSRDRRTIEDLLRLGKNLGSSPIGHGDDKYLRQIHVDYDMLSPRYFQAQHDTYGVFTVKNSQSTMHKGKKLDYDLLANAYVDPFILARFKVIVKEFEKDPTTRNLQRVKSNLPEGIRLAAGYSTSYAQLKTIYYQRRTHRLPEWQEFCDWIETLPYARELGVTTRYAVTCVAEGGHHD